VDASVKAGLLDLIDHAVAEGGWSARRACTLLGLDHWRAARWFIYPFTWQRLQQFLGVPS
jgi:hypothetical protein